MRPEAGADGLEWELRAPLIGTLDVPCPRPGWLAELEEFRGGVLFGSGGGAPARSDADPFDGICHHPLARHAGRLVGCVRLSRPLARAERRAYFQDLEMGEQERRLPSDYAGAAVCGRWVVDPGHRGMHLAFSLVAGALVVARSLGIRHLLSAAGTALGQDRLLLRSGGLALPDFPPSESRRFGQPVRLLCHLPFEPAANFAGNLARMEALLAPQLETLLPAPALSLAA